ncbi:conserved hypothetical protein [Candida dubliniensis CD36]|uniref:Uncharacterized protein n=1 Tax=Candida dubliniensis (strain CD36 / ATCC MYA-646 / CBS 7987 / NCPF 3949 / NRRL Y-17841) TaxID=573826 RepID=B9WM95_CANDC|nr:conserved hypothetical protein [Candida dubliniensis CD36]CAX40208.1 conserved hypothetical protein [Candida dubliniensis CD36]
MATTTIQENTDIVKQVSLKHTSTDPRQQEIINNLLLLAQKEQQKGNTSITSDKLDKLTSLLSQQQSRTPPSIHTKTKLPPKPKYPSVFNKFDINKSSNNNRQPFSPPVKKSKSKPRNTNNNSPKKYYRPNNFSLKKIEFIFVNILENLANLLDNLHLLSNLPMFPQFLNRFLKQTNKIWVLILVFLIRKTISQLLNVIRKIRKVNIEVDLLNTTTRKSKINSINEDLNTKYKKVLKDLRFDKMMLVIELIGNFLDLTFNLIELYGIVLPDWIMSLLNFASMAMTIYRMNKDDEYVDDDITEDLI